MRRVAYISRGQPVADSETTGHIEAERASEQLEPHSGHLRELIDDVHPHQVHRGDSAMYRRIQCAGCGEQQVPGAAARVDGCHLASGQAERIDELVGKFVGSKEGAQSSPVAEGDEATDLRARLAVKDT